MPSIFARKNGGFNNIIEFDESLSRELPQIACGDINIADEMTDTDVVKRKYRWKIKKMSFKIRNIKKWHLLL